MEILNFQKYINIIKMSKENKRTVNEIQISEIFFDRYSPHYFINFILYETSKAFPARELLM